MNFKTTIKRTLAVLICLMLVLTSFQLVATADAKILTTDKTSYEVGEDIKVTAVGSGDQWVGIFNAEDVPSAECGSYYWYYVEGNSEGIINCVSGGTYVIQSAVNNNRGPINVGEYKVCLFADGGYTIAEEVYITITEASNSRFKTDKKEYVVGEPIMITAEAAGKDWIGIYEKGSVPSSSLNSIYWIYTSASSGTPYSIQEGDPGRNNHDYTAGNFFGLPAGQYDLVYCSNDGYTQIERQTITINTIVYDNLATNKNAYIEGEDVFVTAEGVGQKVAIYKTSDTENETPVFEYVVDDTTNGKELKVSAEFKYGSYKVVMFNTQGEEVATVYFNVEKRPYDDVLSDEENVEQTSENGLLKTDKLQYKVGEPIMVTATVSEQEAENKAWVAIVPMGKVPSPGGTVASFWYYVNDTKFGAQNGQAFDILKSNATNSGYQGYTAVTTGYYDIILLAEDGYKVLDKITIARYAPSEIETSLKIEKSVYQEGESVYVTASSPEYYAWVGVFRADDIIGPEVAIYWYWVDYANSIPVDVVAAGKIGVGDYKVVMFNDDGYSSIVAVEYFTIEGLDTSNTTFDFTINGEEVENGQYIEIKKGDKIVVTPFAEGDAIGLSWVGFYKEAQLDATTDFSKITSTDWASISDINGQEWDITSKLSLGANTVALFSNGGYDGIVKYVCIYVERPDVVSKEVISQATCTEPGAVLYVYADGTEEIIVVFATGHNLEGDEKVEATPDQIGGVKKKCTKCDFETITDEVKFDISKTEITVTSVANSDIPKVSVVYNGQKLESGKHYIVELSGKGAERKVRVIGTQNCTGIVEETYEVINKDLIEAQITVANAIYSGKEVTPAVTVVWGDKTLVENVDYTLTYSDNVDIGFGKVTVSGLGDYVGTVDKIFEIKTAAQLGVVVKLSKTNFVYNGKIQKPTVTVKIDGEALAEDKFTVEFSKTSKAVGKYSVTVTLSGDYSGSITKTFVINPKAISIKKLTAGKKSFTVTWEKQTKEVSGYEIVYSTKKNFKKSTTVKITKAKTAKKVIKKLKAKTKYFVKIRTTKKVGKTTFKSSWSKVKSIKTK